MQFKDIGSVLLQAAPTIAGLFGGPLAAMGVTEAEKVFGLTPTPDATPNARQAAVLSALSGATPDQLIALKQADNALTSKLVDGGVQLEQIAAADRASARDLQAKTNGAMAPLLACLVVLGAIIGEGYAMTHTIPAGAEIIVGRVLGTLDGALMLVLAFYFGSSSGSSEKNAMIDKALSK